MNPVKTVILVLVVAIVSAGATGAAIYYIDEHRWQPGMASEVALWWENFSDPWEPRIKLAEEQEKGNPYKQPYVFNDDNDWFTHKLPAWQVALKDYVGKPNVNYLEVGVYEGRSVMWMLENVLTHPTSTVTAVDIFFELDGKYSPELQARYEGNVALAGATDRSTVLVGWSQEVLRTLPMYHYDIIYIDASHYAPQVLEDLILAHRLLKVGGLMILDDYRHWMHKPPLARPKMAVDSFIRFYGTQYEIVHIDYQVILRKREPSTI